MKNQPIKSLVIGITTIFAFAMVTVAQEGQPAPQRSIVKITGDLYRAQNNQHYTVVLVTDAGIIISDPINNEFAAWLKQELNQRFGQPVKYVLYSHHHWDHAAGGSVFNDTATFIGHANMAVNLAPPDDLPLSGFIAAMDTNSNGTIETGEATGPLAGNFSVYDSNGDGSITGAEYARGTYRDVRVPDLGYSDRLSVTLGGRTVEMIYTGLNHSDDMSVLYFPAEKTVFIVDFINVKRLPFRNMGGGVFPDWIDSIKAVEAIDFDIFAPGHGDMGTRQDVIDHRQYLEDLVAAVAAGIQAGKSVAELQQTISLDAYQSWGQYDAWRAENIAGMYEILKAQHD